MKNTQKLLIFCIISFLTISNPKSAVACSCGHITVAAALKYADIVFTGRVVSKTSTTNLSSYRVTVQGDTSSSSSSVQFKAPVSVVKIKLDKIYKGKSGSDTITIITALRGASCGIAFQEGEKYTVFASTNDFMRGNLKRFSTNNKTYFAHLCYGTSRYSEDTVREIKVIIN